MIWVRTFFTEKYIKANRGRILEKQRQIRQKRRQVRVVENLAER